MSRTFGTGQPAASRRLRQAIFGLALLAAGCGGDGPPAMDLGDREPPAADTLEVLVREMEQAFRAARPGVGENDAGLDRAFTLAEELLHYLSERERPAAGWSAGELAAALRRHGVVARAVTIEEFEEPWILLLDHPTDPAAAGRAFLVYAAGDTRVRLPGAAFGDGFTIDAWEDESGTRLAVASWSRETAGSQPRLWCFRLPDPERVAESARLEPQFVEPLGEAGGGEVELAPAEKGAPAVRVEGAVLANPVFDECPTCAHLEADLVYRIESDGLSLISRRVRRTPYASFVRFVQALLERDVGAYAYASEPVVVEQALDLGLGESPRRGRWRLAPGVSATSLDQTYLRGDEGAYRVLLSVRDTNFVVTAITPTEFRVD